MGKFDDVIPSDKLEHIKPKKTVLKEIYENTERKVLHNQEQLLEL